MATLTKKDLLENSVFLNAPDDAEILIPNYVYDCADEIGEIRLNKLGDILICPRG